jgi:molybdopterin converting factor small subunit
MARLIIPTPLRKFTNDKGSFESSGQTVEGVIQDLVKEYQGLKPHLFDSEGKLRSFVRIYVGDEDIQGLEREQTAVSSDTVISIIPAIAGGIN